jgi:hypothetical protein
MVFVWGLVAFFGEAAVMVLLLAVVRRRGDGGDGAREARKGRRRSLREDVRI